MYKQFIIPIPRPDNDIMDKRPTQAYSQFRAKPVTKYAGNWYGPHKKKDMTAISNKFQNKERKVYRVTNPFEHMIENYTEDIHTVSHEYFDLKQKPKIMSRAFYKLWEVMMQFPVADKTGKISVVTLAEAPGSFLQSIMFYRSKILNQNKDAYYCISIHSENQSVPSLHKEFTDFYKKRIMIHETCCLEESKNSKKDTGDLTDIKTINNFEKKIKVKAELVTGDAGKIWQDENMQEQEMFVLLLGQVTTAVRVQAFGGNFVLKVYETQCRVTIKLIMLLYSFYETIYMHKPLMSRDSNSEKYLVCTNFQYKSNDKELQEKISVLNQLLVKTRQREDNDSYLNDIFIDYNIEPKIEKYFLIANNRLMNDQYFSINSIITYVNSNNYYGDEYNKFRDAQIQANEYWLQTFYPIGKNNIENLKLSLKENVEKNIRDIEIDVKEKTKFLV